ncbi:MAG TPA: cell wall hydrolase [Rhizomicrobium sp.]|jgi:hypothetical protein
MTEKYIVALRRADRAIVKVLAFAGIFCAVALLSQPTRHSMPNVGSGRGASVDLSVPSGALSGNKMIASDGVLTHAVQPFAPQITPVMQEPLALSPMELALERILAEQRCLAEAMYYEARGEGTEGEMAIAEVVFHRMRSTGYPHSVCGVVYQGTETGRGCQFSFACDGEMQRAKTRRAWVAAKTLASRIMAGFVRLGDVTGDAISFHAVDVQPEWGDHLVRTIQIGNHIFYRAASRSDGDS